MVRGKVVIDISERVRVDSDGLENALKGLAIKSEDSYDFEDLLKNAVMALYIFRPGGEENYGGEKPLIGKVFLSRFNNPDPGKVNVEYNPSDQYEKRWKYVQTTLVVINLRNRTYSRSWDESYNEQYHQRPEVLMKDTEEVMGSLGLKFKKS